MGIRLLVVPGGVLAGVPLLAGYKVMAAGEDTHKKIKASELPVYEEDKNIQFEFIEETVSPYRANVSKVRTELWNYLDSVQETTTKIQDKWEVAKAHTNNLATYFKEDAGALPRAGVIVVAGLGGVVAGYKGGNFRKATFATMGMVSAAAICYPYQAVDISSAGWEKVKGHAMDMWQKPGKKTEPVEKTKPQPIKKEDVIKQISPKDSGKQQKKIEGDPGMSKEEDKDMYTTRS